MADLDVDLLRRWVRDELDPIDRRRVGQWMIRSQDPTLPDVLFGLVHEWEEAKADASVLARFPAMRFAVDLWRRLWEAGAADLRPLSAVGGAALLGPAGGPTGGFRFVRTGDRVVVEVTLVDAADGAVFASTDAGAEHTLSRVANFAGTWLVGTWDVDPLEGRVTFWLCTAAPGAVAPERLATLATAAADPSVTVTAARWAESG